MSNAAELYQRDFHAWTQDQAAMLRALPERLRRNAIDIEHLAEEIEDLGGSQRKAVKSVICQILIHALKLGFHPAQVPHSHWREEIGNFRAQLDDVFALSPSLRPQRADIALAEWQRAARQAIRSLEDDGFVPEAARLRQFSAGREYFSLDTQVLNPDWFP